MNRLLNRFRRRVRVDITCPHGAFIPGASRMDGKPHRYGCSACGFKVTVRDIPEWEFNW